MVVVGDDGEGWFVYENEEKDMFHLRNNIVQMRVRVGNCNYCLLCENLQITMNSI